MRNSDLYVLLIPDGDVWVASEWVRERPSGDQPYLACNDRSWQIECGVDSFFLPQDEAKEMELTVQDGAIAQVRIDSRGNASVVGIVTE